MNTHIIDRAIRTATLVFTNAGRPLSRDQQIAIILKSKGGGGGRGGPARKHPRQDNSGLAPSFGKGENRSLPGLADNTNVRNQPPPNHRSVDDVRREVARREYDKATAPYRTSEGDGPTHSSDEATNQGRRIAKAMKDGSAYRNRAGDFVANAGRPVSEMDEDQRGAVMAKLAEAAAKNPNQPASELGYFTSKTVGQLAQSMARNSAAYKAAKSQSVAAGKHIPGTTPALYGKHDDAIRLIANAIRVAYTPDEVLANSPARPMTAEQKKAMWASRRGGPSASPTTTAKKASVMPPIGKSYTSSQKDRYQMLADQNAGTPAGRYYQQLADTTSAPRATVDMSRYRPQLPEETDRPGQSYNPKPGYGTPPNMRGMPRTKDWRDGDGDGIDDRDQDGPGMPKYGSPRAQYPAQYPTPPRNDTFPGQPSQRGPRQWGESRPGEMYPQVEGPGNPSWERRNPPSPGAATGAQVSTITLPGRPSNNPVITRTDTTRNATRPNQPRRWGESRPGEMYPQVEGPGNPSWERRNPR